MERGRVHRRPLNMACRAWSLMRSGRARSDVVDVVEENQLKKA